MTFLLLLLLKSYIVALFLRWIMTQQELTFNFLGRGIAKITDPLLAQKGRLKSETDRFIPLIIALITLFLGVVLHFFKALAWGAAIIFAINEMALFLTLFFAVCILLGSMASPSLGALPLYFFRLGNIWVKPIRKIFPFKGNIIVVPTLLLIMVFFAGIHASMTFAYFALYPAPSEIFISLQTVAPFSAAVMVKGLTKLLYGLIIVIIARALISWVSPNPRNPIVQLIYYITEPILAPARKVIPPLGILDLSALVTIAGLSFLYYIGSNILMVFVNKSGLSLIYTLFWGIAKAAGLSIYM